jgi:hypothetical protein
MNSLTVLTLNCCSFPMRYMSPASTPPASFSKSDERSNSLLEEASFPWWIPWIPSRLFSWCTADMLAIVIATAFQSRQWGDAEQDLNNTEYGQPQRTIDTSEGDGVQIPGPKSRAGEVRIEDPNMWMEAQKMSLSTFLSQRVGCGRPSLPSSLVSYIIICLILANSVQWLKAPALGACSNRNKVGKLRRCSLHLSPQRP